MKDTGIYVMPRIRNFIPGHVLVQVQKEAQNQSLVVRLLRKLRVL